MEGLAPAEVLYNSIPFGINASKRAGNKVTTPLSINIQELKVLIKNLKAVYHKVNLMLMEEGKLNTLKLEAEIIKLKDFSDKLKLQNIRIAEALHSDTNSASIFEEYLSASSLFSKAIEQLYEVAYTNTFNWSEEEMEDEGWQAKK